MRKLYVVLTLIFLNSCGAKNQIQPIPNNSNVEEKKSVELVEATDLDKSIQVGNYVVYEVPKIISISAEKKCSYFIQTRVYISQVDVPSDTIELTISKSERASQRNSRQCPTSFGVNETNLKNYSLKKLIASYKNRASVALSPEKLCQSIKNCVKATKVRTKRGSYKGVSSTYTVIDFELISGEKFRKNSWVAMDNLFLNNFSYNIKSRDESKIIDFKRALDFSMSHAK